MSGSVAEGERPGDAGARPDRLTVLVVEQQHDIVRNLLDAVAGQPITLAICADAAEALLVLGRTSPDAVLVGPVHGSLDPIEFIRVVRSDDPDMAVLAGAGSDAAEFAAGASTAGATAVIPRPYRVDQLLALLRSLTPRAANLRLRPQPIDLGRLRIDGAIPQAWVDGTLVSIPPIEFLLLRSLGERVGHVVTRAELVDAVWGGAQPASSNTLTVHVMRLRKRLGEHIDAEWIRSVRGIGYQLTVPGETRRAYVPRPR